MTVVVRADSSRAHSPDGVQTVRLAPGDIVRGRILDVTSDGRTTLRIGPHQVVSDRTISGRPGDILLFEVLPSSLQRIDGATSSEPLTIRLLESARPASPSSGLTTPGKASAQHLPLARRAAARNASAPVPVENQGSAHRPVALVVSALQLVETVRVLGRKWIQRSRYRLAPDDRRESDAVRREPRPRAGGRAAVNTRATNNADRTAQPASDGCGDYTAGFKLVADRDHSGKALIKLRDPKNRDSRRESDGTLTAWLGLDLENTGNIEIDVQMSVHLLRVRFSTDNQDTADAIRSEAGRIHTALKHLVPEGYCCVQVDGQRHMDADASKHRADTANTGIDCTI